MEGPATAAEDAALPEAWRQLVLRAADTLRLPIPVPHPGALAALEQVRGWPSGAGAALAREEVYVEEDGRLCLYPWYRHQDDELAPPAAARAAVLGVGLPPRFLDEPFECCWYLARAGRAAVGALATLDAVPAWPATPLGEEPPVPAILFQRLAATAEQLADRLRYLRDDPERQEEAAGWLAAQVDAYLRGVVRPDRALLLEDEDFQRPLEPAEPHDYGDPLLLTDVRFAGEDGLLLSFVGGLVHADLHGRLRGVFPAAVSVEHLGADGLVLTYCGYGHWHVLDLGRGAWTEGPSLASLLGGGALDGIVPALGWTHGESSDPDEGHRSKWLTFTPDHRHYAGVFRHRAAGIFRAADQLRMPSRLVHDGEDDEDDEDGGDEPDETDVPVLLEGGDASSVVLRGVRFTPRRSGESGWVLEDTRHQLGALVRRPEGFRVYGRRCVRDEDRTLLRFGVPVFAGGFDRDGERLIVAGRRQLHLVQLDPPSVVRTIDLEPLRAAMPPTPGAGDG